MIMTLVTEDDRGSEAKPLDAYTSDDHSSIIMIVTIVSCLVMSTTIAAKFVMQRKTRGQKPFDLILVAGALILLVQSALTVYTAHCGLGRREDELSVEALRKIRQLQYISTLLSIASVACAKCSLALVIIAINDMGLMFYASRALLVLILLFFLTSSLVTAFQRPLPTPWLDTGTSCPGATIIYEYITISSMVTDTLLCGLAVAMVWVLRDGWTKLLTIALFASRILYEILLNACAKTSLDVGRIHAHLKYLIVHASILRQRLAHLHRCPITSIPTLTDARFLISNNFTWLAVSPTVWQQVSYNLSVITACIPSIKVVLDVFSGNTFTIAIDAPYEMEPGVGNSGCRIITKRGGDTSSDHRPRRFSGKRPGCTSPDSSKDAQSDATCSFEDGMGHAEGHGGGIESESVVNLTCRGVIALKKDVEAHFGTIRSPSQDPNDSWDEETVNQHCRPVE